MATDGTEVLIRIVTGEESAILSGWLGLLKAGGSLQSGRIREAELETQAKSVLGLFREALRSGGTNAGTEAYSALRDTLGGHFPLARNPGLHPDRHRQLRALAQGADLRRPE